jgi:hypothetical protein
MQPPSEHDLDMKERQRDQGGHILRPARPLKGNVRYAGHARNRNATGARSAGWLEVARSA